MLLPNKNIGDLERNFKIIDKYNEENELINTQLLSRKKYPEENDNKENSTD